MIRNRSLLSLLLGAWLGASILVDIAVTQNFQSVDRFLAAPGNPETAAELNAVGPARERAILRRNAAEENNWIFMNWERAELAMGAVVLLMLMAQTASGKFAPAGAVALLVILAVEHFVLTPGITSLGRVVDRLTSANPQYKTFWMMHGFYSGLDILKMLIIFGLGARLAFAPTTVAAEKQKALING